MERRKLGAGTRVVRAARSLPPGEGTPVVPPLVQSVAFDYGSAAEQDAVFGGERSGYVYGRYGTPTTAAPEQALADLDGVAAATCFVSGMAAIAAAVDACAVSRGGRVVAQEDCYGQTRALFERWSRERGADVVFTDTTDHAAVEAALAARPTALLYAEAIANPLLRVRGQCDGALAVARHLAGHAKVARVRYPGLPDHPQHQLATRQFGGLYGGVVSFQMRDDTRAAAFRFLDALELAASATTIGDLFTEVLYPPISSHRRLPADERRRLGISDGFLRLSVGIEEPEDILADIDRALDRV